MSISDLIFKVVRGNLDWIKQLIKEGHLNAS